MENVLTIKELMSKLKISRSCVDRAIKTGNIKTIKIGTHIRIPESEYNKILEKGIETRYIESTIILPRRKKRLWD